ncbi:sugar ABC transporter permease [Spirochaetia bacterium]|nr:sugar ABC transporter permease [Spirochaetia bacterium]
MIVASHSPGETVFKAINYGIIAVLTISCFYPLWYTLCVSLSSKSAVDAGFVTIWPVKFTLISYSQLIGDMVFLNSFWISTVRTVVGTVLTLLVLIMLAYPLSKSKNEFFLRNPLIWLLVFCMLFSGGLVPWFITMQKYRLMNKIIGLVLAGGLPVFNTVLVMNYFRSIPRDLEEAAIVDGARSWVILWRIVVPCSVPVLATIALFTGVGHWNDFFNGLVLSSGPQYYPLQTYIRQMIVNIPMDNLTPEMLESLQRLSNKSLDAAKVFVALIPMLCVYPFLQRYFITGIMLGSVKE